MKGLCSFIAVVFCPRIDKFHSTRLVHLKIYDLSEQLPLLAAMLRWCGQLRTIDLPEIVFYSEAGDGDGELEARA